MKTKTRPCRKRQISDLLGDKLLPGEGVENVDQVGTGRLGHCQSADVCYDARTNVDGVVTVHQLKRSRCCVGNVDKTISGHDVAIVLARDADNGFPNGSSALQTASCNSSVLKRKATFMDHSFFEDDAKRCRSSSGAYMPLSDSVMKHNTCFTPELKRKAVCVEDSLLGNSSTSAKKKAIYVEGNASNDDDTDPSICTGVASTPAVDSVSCSNEDMVAQPVWDAFLAGAGFQGMVRGPVILDFQSGSIQASASATAYDELLPQPFVDTKCYLDQRMSTQAACQAVPQPIYPHGTLRGVVVLDFQSRTILSIPNHHVSQGSCFHASEEGFAEQTTTTTFVTGQGSHTSEPFCFNAPELRLPSTNRLTSRIGPPEEYMRFGPCNRVCRNCKAMFWDEEKLACSTITGGPLYHRCCLEGRVKLFVPLEYPPFITQLFADAHFLEHIRAYNQMFAMTSLGANIDESVNVGRGPYVFKISGQIYHRIGRLCPEPNKSPRFLQLYIYDTANEVHNRLSNFTETSRAPLRPDIVQALIEFLDSNNALVQLFRTARDKLQENDIPEFKVRLFNVGKASQYQLPTADDIGAIVFDDTAETEADFDVILEAHSGQAQRINKLHAIYMSAQFPLLFLYGEHGYHLDLYYLNVDSVSTRRGKRMSMKAFYTFQLHDRLGYYNLLSRGGRLFQQYVVTAYCCIEQSRMDFVRANQADIRGDYLAGVYDAISRGDSDGSDIGSRIILPSSFTGGPRYMYSHYLDALAICRIHGNPSFFVTFTCNTRWPEIQEYMDLYPNLTAADRPDVVDRIFERKIHALIKYVRERRPFGILDAVLYTVEFQKRGLPHCHILLWVTRRSEAMREVDVDRYISAELPDQLRDPEGFRIISEFMVHGPCGSAFPNAACMQNRTTCKKYFPKQYCASTYIDKSGYVHYRRRDLQINATRHGVRLDNAYVVPYNRELCMMFYAHINVEYCGWTMLIKYLFKYISKGTNRIIARITREIGEQHLAPSLASGSSTSPNVCIDEIKNFVDARYIGPHEACWRILGFDIHSREPAVQILAVHLENMQSVTFRGRQTLQSVVDNPGSRKTTLTEWLAFNEAFTLGRHLTYLQFPAEFVWSKADKAWSPRRYLNKPAIGRLAYVHPSAGDLFYQRMLLCHQKGCVSFPAIRTVNGHTYATNRGACEAMGLLEDDQEWITAMQEASATATASQLRAFFSEILIFTDVTNPLTLWHTFWRQMSDDIPMLLSQLFGKRFIFVNDSELQGGVLYELQTLLSLHGKSLKDFGLPTPPEGLLGMFRNREVMEEKSYDRAEMAAESRRLIPLFNHQQRNIFDTIMCAVTHRKQELLFVYGHGGTGKTFLWKTVITTLRAEGKIVLAVASSGIASLLLPSGRTAHSRFKIPLQLTDESVCMIKKKTQLADLLKETEIVIWDEAPMNEKRCFEALDRTLRDVLDNSQQLFGGKPIILGGDFRQTLPVKKAASKETTIASSIAQSYLWRHFKVFFLLENMRLEKPSMTQLEREHTKSFSEWLLNIGDGNAGLPDNDDPQNTSWVHIPDTYCFPPTEQGLLQLVDFIYDAESLQMATAASFQQKAIVCPKNETADQINAQILDKVLGTSEFYTSVDEAVPVGNDGGAAELLYPAEYLNSMKFPGIPPHKLEVKIGVPAMLLRNLNLTGGLCNGTRMIVSQMLTRVIEAKIITGTRVGEKVFLPRIVLTVKEERMPFIFKRKQFPIKLCYAMTINKSQGQSLEKIGVYLPEPIFGHGQLYVALSRATSPAGLKMIIGSQPGQPPNTTKNIVYKNFLNDIRLCQNNG